MKNKVYTYKDFNDDFFDDGKPHELPPNYEYIKTNFLSRLEAKIVYGLAVLFGGIYCKLFLHTKYVGVEKLRKHKGGFILYGNHTQPVGDAFIPAIACLPKRIYTVVSPANFDVPVIGKILRPLGALPLPSTLGGMKAFSKAIATRIEKHPIVIYPEAHVWPYYTKIRPFPDSAFKYPEKLGVPAFSMTSTYRKRKFGKKPKLTVYIDGPFYPMGDTVKERANNLRNTVFTSMTENSKKSNYCYVKYRKILK